MSVLLFGEFLALPAELAAPAAPVAAIVAAVVATCVTMMAETTTFCAFARTAGGKSAPILPSALNASDNPWKAAPNKGMFPTGLLSGNSFGAIILGLVQTYL